MRSAFKEAALDWAMEALGIYRVLEPTITADEELGDVTLEWKFRTFSWFAVNGRTSRRGHLPLWGRIKGV
jgi:hypothetical protein